MLNISIAPYNEGANISEVSQRYDGDLEMSEFFF